MDKDMDISTLTGTSYDLDKDEGGKLVEERKYWCMVHSPHPNIMFVVYLCACFQASLKESHLFAVKCIMRYPIGTPLMSLLYPNGAYYVLFGYSDSNFSRCKLDLKSTFGTYHLLGNPLVSWHSKKQESIVLSISKVEYVVVGSCCA